MVKLVRNTVLLLVANTLIYSNAFAAVTLADDRNNEIVLQFSMPHYSLGNVVIKGKRCTFVSVPGAVQLNKKGLPSLPYFFESVIIPGDAEMGVEIVSAQYKEVNVNTLLPSKGTLYRNQNPALIPYEFDVLYTQDTWYPEEPVILSAPFIIRDVRGIVVYFQPFQYNPVKGVLKIAESMTIKIKRIGISTQNILIAKNSKYNPTFSKMYQKHFINFQANRNRWDPVEDGDGMIVIATSTLKSTMEPFVEWKNQMGIKTTLYEYPTETGSGASALKSFIQDKYDTDAITYILLVGDGGDIPPGTSSNGDSDPSYTKLAGSDGYGDALIGRFSVSSVSQAEIVVAKNLWYEQEPDPGGAWYHKAFGIGGDDEGGTGLADWERINLLKDKLTAYTITEMDEIYHSSATSSQVKTAVEEGRSLGMYIGHGSVTAWSTSGFNATAATDLENTEMTPAIISVACVNGDFNGNTCFAEAWQLAGSATEPRGSIIFCASTINQSWVPPCVGQSAAVDNICEENYLSFGACFVNGEFEMVAAGNGQDMYDTWHLFGDPSLVVHTDTPAELTVTAPSGISTGTQNIDLSFDKAIDGRVGLYGAKNGFLSGQIVSGRPNATVAVDVPSDETSIKITVTGRNCLPYIKDVNVGNNSIAFNNTLNRQAVLVKRTQNSFTVRIPNTEKHTITLWNVLGKKVASFTVSQPGIWHAFNVPASGMHFISIEEGNKKVINKFFLTK